jgi:hypothetical protein
MKTYLTPAVVVRGDVVRETLTNKPLGVTETASRRGPHDMNLSFGL